ncbi:MAG: hypothetical protein QOF37_399 [Thermoleophilaceae bacterium]|nr:hypothetical protein [Thermoleophilaceae bacterium]
MPSFSLGRRPASIAALAAALLIAAVPAAQAAPSPAVTVAVHTASGPGGSYFDIWGTPGKSVAAGTLELHNTARHPVTVLVDPVGALTASTLGSAYQVRAIAPRGPATWTRFASRRLVLGPLATSIVPVSVALPAGAPAGDYLSGVSVQSLTKPDVKRMKGNVAIASVQRYAVGLVVRVPGPRTPLIRLTHASVKREPSGLTFYVYGTNAGNAILQNVYGSILVTKGKRVVARTPVGPATFVTGTSIAYPLLTRREQPREGSVYRVRATMHYASGRVARLDQQVRFGHGDAVRQQEFGGPRAEGQGFGWGKFLAGIVALLVLAGIGLVALLRRRRQLRGRRATPRIVSRAVMASRSRYEPLTALRISDHRGDEPPARIVPILRTRLRRNDLLLRVPGTSMLVLASGSDLNAAALLAGELRKQIARRAPRLKIVIEIVPLEFGSVPEDLLSRPAKAWAPPAEDRADTLDLDSINLDRLLDPRDDSARRTP